MPDYSNAIAERFVRARLDATSLPDYPGAIPGDLDAAYLVQEVAIAKWADARPSDPVVGCKVGLIKSPWAERFGETRLIGPIFRDAVQLVRGKESIAIPVFDGGFGAVEAEFVFRLSQDAPLEQLSWTHEEAADLVASFHIAIEPAGSPLATINDLGPSVVVSDFGNNAGLLLGAAIQNWRDAEWSTLTTETLIDEQSVGRGSAASLPGGPLDALAFALTRHAQRGRPMKANDLISTGATTGIHRIFEGQRSRVDFGVHGEINCHAVRALRQTQG